MGVDRKLTALAEDRSAKDDEMKGLERTLVQVLVEQQKKLLALLSEVSCGLHPLPSMIYSNCISRLADESKLEMVECVL